MTSPRGTYGGGSYSPPSFFQDTPIYDRLVAERGTPQIAPIRVPSAYESAGNLPALPALPALPSAPVQHTPPHGTHTGYPQAAQPVAPGGYPQYSGGQQHSPAPYIPQQATVPRPHPGGYQQQPHQGGTGYEAARPVPPRPVPPRQATAPYGDEYPRRSPQQEY